MKKDIKKIMKLGVTGGIGSGKTSVCKVFSVLGIPIFFADTDANGIMNSDKNIMREINKLTGKDLYAGGTLDRRQLADIIFHDQNLLKEVNSLVHPVVSNNFIRWAEAQTTPYVIMEAAILFESGASELVDRIATVIASVEERIERVTQRNTLSREQVIERINNQMSDAERIKRSDYIINNSENEMIIPAILRIHEDILEHLYS